jgi:SpoIIAA-like
MVEPIEEMPAGTLGFRAHGELTRSDYRGTLIPALREAVEAGAVRLMVVVADDFEKMDLGARIEDAKADLSFARSSDAWERTALVTDVGWIRRFFHLFSWLAPGELRVFGLAEEDEARAWVAAQTDQ